VDDTQTVARSPVAGARALLSPVSRDPLLARRVVWGAWFLTRAILFAGMILGRNFCDAEFYKYAGAITGGSLPYQNFPVEYPPVAILLMLLPALPLVPFARIAPRVDVASGAALVHLPAPDPVRFAAYGISFGIEMLVIDAITLVLVRKIARRYVPGDPQGAWSSLLYILLVFCSGALLQKFDLAAGTLCLLAVAAMWDNKPRIAGLALAGAVLIKGFPLLLLPVLAVYAIIETQHKEAFARRMRGAVELVVASGAALALVTGIVIVGSSTQAVLHTITYHTGRAAEIESLYANAMLVVGWIPGLAARTAFEVDGLSRIVLSPLGNMLDPASVILTAGLPLLVYVAYGRHSLSVFSQGHATEHEEQRSAAAALAIMLAFMLAFRALPAHYILALLPLAAITRLPRPHLQRLWIAGIVAVGILGQVLAEPAIWHDLVLLAPGGVILLTLRNLAWIVAFSVLVVALCQWPSAEWQARAQESTHEGKRRPAEAARG